MTRINGKMQLLHRVIAANSWNCNPEDIKGVVHHRNGNVQDNRKQYYLENKEKWKLF